MKVHEIMTAHARCIGPDNMLVEAAGLMRELDVGALPVCDNDRLAGMVTDRDIVLRGTADGRDPNTTTVRDVMSQGIIYVFADQDVEEAGRMMEAKQIRRMPVLNREKRLVGIVSLGDLATTSSPIFSGLALRDVSMPNDPSARQRRLAQASRGMEPMPRAAGGARRPAGTGKRRGGGAKKKTSRSRGASARGGRSSQTRAQKTSPRSRKTSKRASR